ncbi:hypothetical protein ACFQ3R_14540 [Mesonia ostreae]|uniref:Sensor of ECF-type sigma factor n=1 Tax=Mesonia ostreae TaxID=861110 RepID=A0ABU2KKV7_9FLAO|nr:hypothetical protein [Mesonia ostreae]MDT0295367.1 hypothetical protein [Mesonia ostreae]
MKKIIYIAFIFLFSSQLMLAQTDDEKIKSLKIAHITKALDLSKKEAESFWPIYNEFEEKTDNLYEVKWCDVKNGIDLIDTIDEETAKILVEQYVSLKEESAALKGEFVKELHQVISYKKILMLKKAERDFHKILLKQYKRD